MISKEEILNHYDKCYICKHDMFFGYFYKIQKWENDWKSTVLLSARNPNLSPPRPAEIWMCENCFRKTAGEQFELEHH